MLTVKTRGFERSALITEKGRTVAEVFTHTEPGDQRNMAALYAAAPALLAALADLLACTMETYDNRHEIAAARDAIAAATGEQ